jgi:transcriptional regulator with XRE-family HTH domain
LLPMTDEIRVIGSRIKTLREWKDWTQGQLAYKARTTTAQISRTENNERPGAQAILVGRIARALSTTVDYLLGLTDFPDPVEYHIEGIDSADEHTLRWFFERAGQLPPQRKQRVMNVVAGMFGLLENGESREISRGFRSESSIAEKHSSYRIEETQLERDLLDAFRDLNEEWQRITVEELKARRYIVRIIGGEEEREEDVGDADQEQTA